MSEVLPYYTGLMAKILKTKLSGLFQHVHVLIMCYFIPQNMENLSMSYLIGLKELRPYIKISQKYNRI